MQGTVTELSHWYEQNKQSILDDFFTFLRFKSISADPSCKEECLRAANWLCGYLKKIGLQSELWPSTGNPVVFASDLSAGEDRPTLLIYHHYDVQPVDPLELWHSPPFEPTIRQGKVFARGASDNKGQCFATLTALRWLYSFAKKQRVNIKVFIEGEEEIGGPGTEKVVREKQRELQADHLLVVDFGLPRENEPGVTLGMRGIVTFDIECKNSSQDLHSGEHGGVALNPNRALVQLLAKVWDEQGRVTIAHFYDDIKGLTAEEKKRVNLDFDVQAYEKAFGVKAYAAEKGCSLKEANWLRPTFEINGIGGGYTGVGFKTVIPSKAIAKVSCRLVPEQDPSVIEKNVREFLQKNCPSGMELYIAMHHGAGAFKTASDAKITQVVATSFEEVFGRPCEYMFCGGSVPIVVELSKACGADVALMGVALSSDDIHAPNEHFGLDNIKQGFMTMARVLVHLSEES